MDKKQNNFGYKNSYGTQSQPSGGSGEQAQTFNRINNQYNYNYNFNVINDPNMQESIQANIMRTVPQ
jgi:hypothetical protein